MKEEKKETVPAKKKTVAKLQQAISKYKVSYIYYSFLEKKYSEKSLPLKAWGELFKKDGVI